MFKSRTTTLLNMECPSSAQTTGESNIIGVVEPQKPFFGLCTAIPEGMSSEIEAAVRDFIATSHSSEGVDPEGFYNQTLQAIANATVLGNGGDFWLGIDGKGVYGYALCRIVQDIDNRLTYWCSQSWMRKDIRGHDWYRYGMEKIKERAKACFCAHLVIVSSRNAKAYLRFLGKNWHPYATLLKEDI